jgi:hypothetical protein
MTFREVKVAELGHFPVFFPDNRELWGKVFSGQENTRKEVGRKSCSRSEFGKSLEWLLTGEE